MSTDARQLLPDHRHRVLKSIVRVSRVLDDSPHAAHHLRFDRLDKTFVVTWLRIQRWVPSCIMEVNNKSFQVYIVTACDARRVYKKIGGSQKNPFIYNPSSITRLSASSLGGR